MVLSASDTSCVGGLSLSFSFDRNPLTGATGSTALGEATTNADGRAKLTVGTTGWRAGSYQLTVSYAGNDLGLRRLVDVDAGSRSRRRAARSRAEPRSTSPRPDRGFDHCRTARANGPNLRCPRLTEA